MQLFLCDYNDHDSDADYYHLDDDQNYVHIRAGIVCTESFTCKISFFKPSAGDYMVTMIRMIVALLVWPAQMEKMVMTELDEDQLLCSMFSL